MADSCSTCNFHRSRDVGTTTVGECHRNPPTIQGQTGVWPHVQPTDWCGEWLALAMEANVEPTIEG